jgi:imidazoleglycerol-phosphate dehydratase
MNRRGHVERITKETQVDVNLSLDGEGKATLHTGVPFLEHMLDLFAKHGQFDLAVRSIGDVHIDDHHTVEDTGICIGRAIDKALGDRIGIRRYGNAFVPMDESLGQVVIDLSGRSHLEFRADFPSDRVGSFDTELVHEFFWKLALESRMNLHVILHYGRNTHHMIESLFKALGRALHEATRIDPSIKGVPSSKGVLG